MSVSMEHLKLFIEFAAKELKIKVLPKIHFVGNKEDAKRAFGHTDGKDISVRITDRHPLDIMRTLAHELIHCKQKSGTSLSREDNANALAGRIMRKFDIKYPNVFKDKSIKANMIEDMTVSALGANHMGSSSSTPGTGGIDTVDPLMKRLKAPIKRKMLPSWDNQFKYNSTQYNYKLPENSPKKLRDILARDYKNERKSDKR